MPLFPSRKVSICEIVPALYQKCPMRCPAEAGRGMAVIACRGARSQLPLESPCYWDARGPDCGPI